MQVNNWPLSQIINIDQGAREHYHVPKYQREYCWGVSQWEKMIQDIDENDPGYFLGSIICVNDSENIAPGDELIYEIIDGQQRLTTLSLMMMAIYKKLKDLEKTELVFDDDDDRDTFQKTIDSINAKLVKKKKDYKKGEIGGIEEANKMIFCRVQPSTQNHNFDDYLFIISELNLIKNRAKPNYCGVRSIYKAYRYFQDNLPQDLASLLKYVEKINRLNFVFISVGSQADAFVLFETLNNRGVPLSAVDIIKNKMLADMEKKHNTNINDAFEQWQEIINALPDPDDQERFFRHFYNAFKNERSVRIDGISRAVKSKIIVICETLIKRDTKKIFDQLINAATIYGNFVDPPTIDAPKVNHSIKDLNNIGGAPAYQVMLYLFSQDRNLVPMKLCEDAVDLLCKYYVRRNVTDIPATRDLDLAHIELIEKCDLEIKKGKPITLKFFTDALIADTKVKPATLDQFKNKLATEIYANNSSMARYLLTKIDTSYHTREYQPNLWQRDEKNRFVWTVEHVFPQMEKISPEWVKMVGDGDEHKAKEIQEKYVHCLGNLTLSGYNSNLSTASFSKKQALGKDRTFLGQKINIGYKNGLALNNLQFTINGKAMCLADAPEWKEQMIIARTQIMSDMLVNLYKFPNE